MLALLPLLPLLLTLPGQLVGLALVLLIPVLGAEVDVAVAILLAVLALLLWLAWRMAVKD
jgi:hypothetical protein